MRLPSGDHTGNSATPAPSVNRVGPASPRQIEQPQVGLRRVQRIRARCDRPSAVRGKRHAAKAARFRGPAGYRALPVEPGELGIGVSGAVHQNVVGGGGKVGAVTKGADPLGHRHRIPRQGKAPRIERLRHERPFAKEQQPSRSGISGRGVGHDRPRTASAAARFALQAWHRLFRCTCRSASGALGETRRYTK